jgi:hypothetical protein
MFAHGWGGDALMDLSNGQEMMQWYCHRPLPHSLLSDYALFIRYSAAFMVSSLLHIFGSVSHVARISGLKKLKGKDRNAKRVMLEALEGRKNRTIGGTGYVTSSDSEKGNEGEGSSNYDDDSVVQSAAGYESRKLLPTSPSKLPSSLMEALTAPPPSPLSMTSEDFLRDFLSKYPPSPKSYEVTAVDRCKMLAFLIHLSQLSIGNKVRRLSKQVLGPFLFPVDESIITSFANLHFF